MGTQRCYENEVYDDDIGEFRKCQYGEFEP